MKKKCKTKSNDVWYSPPRSSNFSFRDHESCYACAKRDIVLAELRYGAQNMRTTITLCPICAGEFIRELAIALGVSLNNETNS
jgi:hypothetical protein